MGAKPSPIIVGWVIIDPPKIRPGIYRFDLSG
jgi:hypothetical protein